MIVGTDLRSEPLKKGRNRLMRFDGAAQLIGASAPIEDLRQEIDRVARTDAKVLITGESGAGKEVVARQVYALSTRSSRPFVAVNCAGLPETLLESELFGHVRGSFTGAYRDKPGKLEIADEGTIFLDEIGEMTLRMQGLLLRFLETGEIQKVGADRTGTRVDVRTIAATNRNLRDMIAQGQFREDLFYRLNVIHLIVPGLRERKEDIPSLVDHFMNRMARTGGRPAKTLSPAALQLLTEYHWPGNVRELQNVIERMIVRARGEVIGPEDIPHEVRVSQRPGTAPFRERRRTIADELYERITMQRQSFWTTVYPLFMQREITRSAVRDVVRRGLVDARGNYKIVARKFNMENEDYKRFLNFLRKHHCQPSFKEFR
ncbi:MAG TPA: sigma-54 dependent transcriptional regulator [Vicinamibacterales bacterium]|nr:sigma-54 dependent transcriptional regulator [Vicinamibacterales bacterium]